MENTESKEVKDGSNKKLNLILLVLVLSVVGNGILGYMLMQEQQTVMYLTGENVEITDERDILENDLKAMLAQYDSLTTENDTISAQLEAERDKVKDLLAKVKSSNWTIYKLKKETESLRKIMKGFVVTIDSLNTANIKLMAENENIKGELGQEKSKTSKLNEEKSQLEGKVKIGQKLQAVFIEAYGQLVKGNTPRRSAITWQSSGIARSRLSKP